MSNLHFLAIYVLCFGGINAGSQFSVILKVHNNPSELNSKSFFTVHSTELNSRHVNFLKLLFTSIKTLKYCSKYHWFKVPKIFSH